MFGKYTRTELRQYPDGRIHLTAAQLVNGQREGNMIIKLYNNKLCRNVLSNVLDVSGNCTK